jgi:hypothetical protein
MCRMFLTEEQYRLEQHLQNNQQSLWHTKSSFSK